MRSFLISSVILLLAGCNAKIGIPVTIEEQPWRTIYLISFFTLCLVPIFSMVSLILIRLIKPTFVKRRIQLPFFTAILFGVMLGLWLILELSLPKNANIRVDLIFVIPALCFQFFLIAISSFFYARKYGYDF